MTKEQAEQLDETRMEEYRAACRKWHKADTPEERDRYDALLKSIVLDITRVETEAKK